jgi:hypothetical protein
MRVPTYQLRIQSIYPWTVVPKEKFAVAALSCNNISEVDLDSSGAEKKHFGTEFIVVGRSSKIETK